MAVLSTRTPHTIRWVPLAIIGVFLLRGVTSFINEYTASWLTGRLVQTLREEMFVKLLRLPVSFYDREQSGRLISRIASDVNQVTEAGFNVITVAVKDGVTTLGLLALLLYTDWQLTLICFVVMPRSPPACTLSASVCAVWPARTSCAWGRWCR